MHSLLSPYAVFTVSLCSHKCLITDFPQRHINLLFLQIDGILFPIFGAVVYRVKVNQIVEEEVW